MFTLVWNRDRDMEPLFAIVPVMFPVPTLIPLLSSVNNL